MNNIGTIIKAVAVFFLAFLLVVSFGVALSVSSMMPINKFLIGLGIFLGGSITSFMIFLFTYGFGAGIEAQINSAEYLKELSEKLSKHVEVSLSTVTSQGTANRSHKDTLTNLPQKATTKGPENSEWRCPDCGKRNHSFVNICSCGANRPKFHSKQNNFLNTIIGK